MAALTAARTTPYYGGPNQPAATFTGQDLIDVVVWPVKGGVKIWSGALVVINAGFAVGATAATGLIPAGQALLTVDNTLGADGDLTIKVQGGVNQWDNKAGDLVTQAAAGKLCFCRDDHTVSLTTNGGTLSPAGTVVNVDANGVWVQAYAPPVDTTTAEVPQSRLISTTAPLAGGGDLSADRTLSIGAFPNANPLVINNAADTFASTIKSGATAARANTTQDAPGILTVAATVGTTTTVLHGNAAAGTAGAFGAVGLTTDVTGVLPVANGGTAGATAGAARAALSAAAIQTPAFTGTLPLGAVNPTAAFSGTGGTAAGQVYTTTDNQTMTLNQCAGMLLVTIGGNFCVILSNTAVVGAQAVLTVAGKLTTDAGVYSIFNGRAPVGTIATLS